MAINFVKDTLVKIKAISFFVLMKYKIIRNSYIISNGLYAKQRNQLNKDFAQYKQYSFAF